MHDPIDHDNALAELEPAPRPVTGPTRAGSRLSSNSEDIDMAWTTPVIVEVCVGMEVTSYSSAEI
ncbi:pyrroloquinoline quinone precursor peptide PqqA [Methylocystis sp. MJC1]|nr:pyrroloquinoline quinone precursor peptide PqqA [Methylocystis sp. MJC1]